MKKILTFAFFAVITLSSGAVSYDGIIAALRAKNINQPVKPSVRKKLNGGFWMTWGLSNGGDCGEYLDFKSAENRMETLKKNGYTGIVVSGRHWRIDRLQDDPQILNQLKLICDLAHKNEMIVISHFDLIQFSLDGCKFALQHPDWWQLDLQTFAPFTKFCVNNAGFRKFYIDYLRNMIKRTGVDGFMLDELNFAQENKGYGSCACRACREAFERETGVKFPKEPNAPEFHKVDDAWYSLFSQWRSNSINHFQKHISSELQKEFPELFFVSYSTGFLEPELFFSGLNFFSHFKYLDSIGVEPPQGSTIIMLPRLYTRCKLRIAVADALDKPLWALSQTPEKPDNLLFMCGFYKAMRHTVWSPRNVAPAQTSWKHWPDPATVRTVPAAALICSELTINASMDKRGDGYHQNRELEGWAGALTARKLTYDVVMSEAMSPELLKKYPVVILPNSAVLTEKEQSILSQYLTSGGVILTSGRFGFDPAKKCSGIRPALEVPMPENITFKAPAKLADGMVVKNCFAKSPRPEWRKVGKGFIGIYPATFAVAESRIHSAGGRTDFRKWESVMAHLDISVNSKLIDSWLGKAFELHPPEVSCSGPEGLLPEILRDKSGKLIISLLDVTGRDHTEILKKSTLSGKFTVSIRGVTDPKSFCVLSPGIKIAPVVAFKREKGYDCYSFAVDKLPVYSQIEVKYE